MNDEFLHRLRKPPSPEFLAALKSRLDRHPLPPEPVPARPRRRFAFSRGLIVGFLLGGAAISIALTSIPGVPHSLLTLMQAPGRLVARLWQHDSREVDSRRTKAVPLGPVWLPEHPGQPSTPQVTTVPAALDAHAGNLSRTGSVASDTAPVASSSSLRNQLVIASPRAFEHATFSMQHCCVGNVAVELDTSSTPFERLCISPRPPSKSIVAAIELSRRITADEARSCTQSPAPPMMKPVELKIGYQAVVLARAKLYGPLRLTSRALFLALAKRTPDPNHPDRLIDNRSETWSQVGPPQEIDRIQVSGPAPDSVAGKLAARLLLEAGCNTYPWIAALHEQNPERYEEICTTLRDDGAYKEARLSGWAYADELVGSPTTVGVFSVDEFSYVKDKLSATPIGGVAPSLTSLASGDYPAAVSLYLYTNKYRFGRSANLYAFVQYNMAPLTVPGDPGVWGFVALDSNEQRVALESLKELMN